MPPRMVVKIAIDHGFTVRAVRIHVAISVANSVAHALLGSYLRITLILDCAIRLTLTVQHDQV